MRQLRLARGRNLALVAVSLVLFVIGALLIRDTAEMLGRHPERIRPFLLWGAGVLCVFHAVPLTLGLRHRRPLARVHPEGDSWRIGRYSEADVRRLAREASAGLPRGRRDPRVFVAKDRGTGGWTFLSLIWPGVWRRDKSVWVTAGALHYLDPDELKALVVHEMSHHAPWNWHGVPGGWLYADAVFWCFAFMSLGPSGKEAMEGFLVARFVAILAANAATHGLGRMSEHWCDLMAARRTGLEATVNLLLKTGEEADLVEAVLERSARQLRRETELDIGELARVFDEVRPHGRIFHDTLFRHAREITRRVRPEGAGRGAGRAVKQDPEVAEWLSERRRRAGNRIRWRRFDADNDGRLSADEIVSLCDTLRARPGLPLFICEGEHAPSSHPPWRTRILLLEEQCGTTASYGTHQPDGSCQ